MPIDKAVVQTNVRFGRRPFEGVVLTELEMTCGACPSQWDGTFMEKADVYIRFRSNRFSVDSPFGNEIYANETLGEHPYDGVLSTEDMLLHTGFTVKSK